MVENKPPSKSTRDPQALSSEYHKARKQLMLWAGILFVWELVGIDLEKAKETGGNAGAIITAIKSPQAIPWVLLILVAYFLFKTTIEWHQCSLARRRLRVSRVDFISAWVVSLGAYVLYLVQAVKKVQVADVVQGPTSAYAFVSLLMSFMLVFHLTMLVNQRLRLRKEYHRPIWDGKLIGSLLASLMMPFIAWLGFRSMGIPFRWSIKMSLLGVVMAILAGSSDRFLPIAFRAANSALSRWVAYSPREETESPGQKNS
jgi:hypothetical protein